MDMQSSQGQTSESTSVPSNQSVGNEVGTRGIAYPSATTPSPENTDLNAMNLPPSTETQVSSKKRKDPINKSPFWETFTRCKVPVTNTTDPNCCTCNYCGEKVSCDPLKNGTSSMHHHSRKCTLHPKYAQKDSKQAKLIASNVTGAGTYHKYNKERCDDRCIEMIIKDELPFRFVEKEGFLAFCKEMEPNWKPMDRKQVAKGVLDKYNSERAIYCVVQ